MIFQYPQMWVIKLCYKSYTKRDNKDSGPLNNKLPWYIRYIINIVYNLRVLKHFSHWYLFWSGGIEIFWAQKSDKWNCHD